LPHYLKNLNKMKNSNKYKLAKIEKTCYNLGIMIYLTVGGVCPF